MAVIWECKITNANPDNYRADVGFTRTDSITEIIEAYSYSKVIIETTAQRLALLDQVWQEHLNIVAKQTAIGTFIAGLEQSAKTNLEARET